MRSLCWKELRENLKWAVLAMVVIGVGEIYAMYQAASSSDQTGVTLCAESFLMVTTFGSAAAGLLLGLLQILPELRRDQWASLLHRPMPRGRIYFGKAAAGLMLYALATLVPFLLSVWLVATPGHFSSPFVPGMVLPGVADICTGVVYYFAALALALQRGKWIGLRAFPVLAAFHCSCFVDQWSDPFLPALEAAVLMAAALCVAGWGTMVHQEKFSARPWPAKAAFLAMVFYGACGLVDLALSILDVVGPKAHSQRVEYVMTDQWVPLRVTYKDQVCVSVTDPEGNPVVDPDEQPSRIGSHSHFPNGLSTYIGDTHGWEPRYYQGDYRDWRRYGAALQSFGYPRYEQWYCLAQQPSLIGYLVSEKKAVARFDQLGFEPAAAIPRPFEQGTLWDEIVAGRICVWDGRSLKYVSLAARKANVLPLPGKGPVYGIGRAWCRDASGNSSVLGVALRDRVAVYDTGGGLLAALPYHQNVDRWGQLALGVNVPMDRFYLWYRPSGWIDQKTRRSMPSYFEEMNRQGEVLRSWTLPPLPAAYRGDDVSESVARPFMTPAFFFGEMAYQEIGALLGSRRLAAIIAGRFGPGGKRTEGISLEISMISLALSAATLFWARRLHFSWSRAAAWAAFVFAFNVAGLITFRLAADWPRMVPCPRCRRPRPITENLCPHCSSGWPEPEPRGTEVFDEAAAAPAGA